MTYEVKTPQTRIRAARGRLGITQRELARRAGVGVRALRDVELGRAPSPNPDVVQRLLDASGAVPTIRVLGAFGVEWAGDRVPIGSRLQRSMLALLALRPGHPHLREEIATSLWGASPPRSWISLLHTYASRLRRILGPDAIVLDQDGYRLMTVPDSVDAARFRTLMAGIDHGDADLTLGLIERGLALWHGRFGAGLTTYVRDHPAAVELESLRADAALTYAELASAAGRASSAATLLTPIVGEYPAHQELRAALTRLLTPATAPGRSGQPAGDATLNLAMLGTVTATRRGRAVNIGGQLGRTVLAALALDPGHTMSFARLTEMLWGERPPITAPAQVHIQISRLRAALRRVGVGDLIRTEPGGYSLRPEGITTDLDHARNLVAQARAAVSAGRHADAMDAFGQALRLWQGPELNGVTEFLTRSVAPRMAGLRQDAAEEQIAAQIDAGSPQAALPELETLIAANPLREELYRLRMLALYRMGRRAEALATYAAAREVLRRELGIDPSPELRALEADALSGGADRPGSGTPYPIAAQLPPCCSGFAGRAGDLDLLRDMLAGRTDAGGGPVVVLAGMPGIGKTALAVHAATRAIDDFPDGQLVADLGGGGPSARPAIAVLGDLLRSLGVNPQHLPRDLAGRVSAWRTLTWPRRILILLDHAATETQVEQLLPAGPGCAVLVTSRHALPGLDVTHRLTLGPLDDGSARRVLTAWAGEAIAAAKPATVSELVRACAGVPLALRIIGGRLASLPHLTPSALAGRLRDEPRRLAELVAGGRSVRASIDACFRLLSDTARSALVWLSRRGGVAYSRIEIAIALGIRRHEVDPVIEELAALHLIATTGSNARRVARYRPHDLVRLYAARCDPPVSDSRPAR